MSEDAESHALPSGPEARPDAVGKVTAEAGAIGTDALSQAGQVVDEARARGTSLVNDVTEQVKTAADDQREGLAEQVSDVANSIHQLGEHFKGNQEWIARIVEAGATELGTLASTLRTNNLEGLIEKLQDLARRQPAIYVGALMAAGFATMRVGRVAAAGASKADLPSMPEVFREPK